jgi:hypothetical protein
LPWQTPNATALLSDCKHAKKGKKKLERMQIAMKMGSLKMSRHLVHASVFLNPTALLALSMTRQAARGKASSTFCDQRKFKHAKAAADKGKALGPQAEGAESCRAGPPQGPL